MDWITQEQAQEAAKQGKLPALECSLKHHEQGRDATRVELINAIASEQFHVQGDLCACCQIQFNKKIECRHGSNCSLRNCAGGEEYCCNGKWLVVSTAFFVLETNHSNANLRTFQQAEAELCEYIEAVIRKVVAANIRDKCDELKTKKCEPERNSEDLEEFRVFCNHGDTIRVNIFDDGSNEIKIEFGKDTRHFTIEQATEFHQKFGQLIAYFKRQQEKQKQEKQKC